MKFNLNQIFEANGIWWSTDTDTLSLMREYRDAGDKYMLSVVFSLGLSYGRIVAS